MKLAVTYKDGRVFEHFGRTEQFKIYDVEDGKVVSSEVVDTNGEGHEALATFLAGLGVDVVICGGMGEGAANAITTAGITGFTGASGDVDELVARFLDGNLTSEGCNCNHHSEEGGCGGSCGGGCGGGCGGCHAPAIEGKNVGKKVKAHYTGTFNDGEKFDSSYDRGEPLEFICGVGQMIRGFDVAVANMNVGDVVDIHLMPEEAYGPKDPNAIFTIEIDKLPGSEELGVGEKAYLTNSYGQPFVVTVVDKTETSITFDANHEMAGKELNFKIELVSIED